jgi:hypothetical protein
MAGEQTEDTNKGMESLGGDHKEEKKEQIESKGVETPKTLDEALKVLEEMHQEKAKNAELLKKVRKFEKENREHADKELLAKEEFKKLYEQEQLKRSDVEKRLTNKILDEKIEEFLKKENAVSVSTVRKLIDKTKIKVEDDEVDAESLKSVVEELKKSDPVLFAKKEDEKVKVPPAERASESDARKKPLTFETGVKRKDLDKAWSNWTKKQKA